MIKNMRRQTIHIPDPIIKYKSMFIKKSEKPKVLSHSSKFTIENRYLKPMCK